jgi:hypothetical protein
MGEKQGLIKTDTTKDMKVTIATLCPNRAGKRKKG